MLVPLNILLVEDSERDTELLVEHLRHSQFEPQIRRAQAETEYLAALRPDLDLIISDFTMPKFDGLRALDLLNIRGYDIPFILFSGTITVTMAQEAIRRGAADCLTKDEPERLGGSVTRALHQRKLRRSSPATERTLESGERKFRALFDGANDSIYMLHNGIFIDCNARGLLG
jgi:DNA-binding NtrC family response regulator